MRAESIKFAKPQSIKIKKALKHLRTNEAIFKIPNKENNTVLLIRHTREPRFWTPLKREFDISYKTISGNNEQIALFAHIKKNILGKLKLIEISNFENPSLTAQENLNKLISVFPKLK